MKKYRVEVPYLIWTTVVIEAESADEALEATHEISLPRQMIGNGGDDKGICVDAPNCTINPPEEPFLLGSIDFDITEIKTTEDK